MTKNSEIYGIRHDVKSRTITLDRTDLSVLDYLQHAKEEAMDLALYLEKTIQMLKGKK